MDYGNILARAWQITWKHKILWLFGILSALGSGGGGSNFNFRGNVSGTDTNPLPPEVQSQLNRPEMVALILVVVCIALVVGLVLFVISVIARGGLIGGIHLADEHDAVTFGEAWSIGSRYFWRMLGIGLVLLAAGLFIGLFGVITGLIAAFTFGLGLICLLPILCVLIIGLIPLSILAHFAQFAVVLEDMRVMDAFRRGWEVIKVNLGNIIVLGFITIILSAIIGFILAIPFGLIALPAIVSTAGSRGTPNTSLLGALAVAAICYLPIFIVLAGILHSWTMSIWTLAYRQFTGGHPAMVAPPPPPLPAQPA